MAAAPRLAPSVKAQSRWVWMQWTIWRFSWFNPCFYWWLFASEPFAVSPSGKNVRGAAYGCWQTWRAVIVPLWTAESQQLLFSTRQRQNDMNRRNDSSRIRPHEHHIALSPSTTMRGPASFASHCVFCSASRRTPACSERLL